MSKGIDIYRTQTSTRAFGSPSRYYQGKGEIDNIGKYIADLGSNASIIIDGYLFDEMKLKIQAILPKELEVGFFSFGGECSDKEIDSFVKYADEMNAEVIIGLGGGKTLDVAKAASHKINAKLIICPSAASTDAPTSALSVVYTEEGVHSHCYYFKTNPDIVLVDSNIIKNAPVRLLVSGMGDAIATYFETMSNEHSDSANYIGSGYRRTRLSLAVAELCYNIITEKGIHAKIEAENHICTDILEDVIEANILLSGLGFENAGCSIAHAIASGLSVLRDGDGYLHGEKVAYGVLVQHVLEGYSEEKLIKLIEFYLEIGLPTTLSDMNIVANLENVEAIAKKSIVDFGPISKFVTIDYLCACILSADKFAEKMKDAYR